jgi:flagellar motor switch protein FliM
MTDMEVNHCPASPAVSALSAELARRLCSGLEDVLHASAQTQAQPPRWAGPDELRLAEPSCQFELSASTNATAAPACLELSPLLADAMIDLVLGSSPQPLGHRRQGLTAVDRQLLGPVIERIVASFNDALAAWPLKLELPDAARTGKLAKDGHRATPEEKLLDLPISVRLGECTGLLRLLLGGMATSFVAMPPLVDSAPSDAVVTLVAAIEETGRYVHDLSNLAQGDLLVTDASAGGEVIVTVNGVPRFAGQLGQYNGHRAVTITRKLDQA